MQCECCGRKESELPCQFAPIQQHHLIPLLAVARWSWLSSERYKPENIVSVCSYHHYAQSADHPSGCHQILERRAKELIKQAISEEDIAILDIEARWSHLPNAYDPVIIDAAEEEERKVRHTVADRLVIKLRESATALTKVVY